MSKHCLWMGVFLAAAWTAAATQDAARPADPFDLIAPAELAEPAAGAEPVGPLGDLTEEELQALIEAARPLRLERERNLISREIEDGLLFDPEQIDAAVADLNRQPKDTPEDNIARALAAFAAVDARLAEPVAQYQGGQYEQAALNVKSLINPAGTGYFDAAKRMLYADALLAMERHEDAIAAYKEILEATPDKISFASTAALRAGQTYERMGRRVYAAQVYQWWLENYGFLDPERAEALAATIEQVRQDYEDPLQTLADKMGQVEARLAALDSGQETQQRENEIIGMLDELIAMAEDANNSGGGGGGGGQQQQQQGGQSSGSSQSAGSDGGQASGDTPSNPAERSVLPGGNSPRPHDLDTIRPSDASDAWGRLPPRERERLVESFRQQYPDRYEEMLEAYFRRLAQPN